MRKRHWLLNYALELPVGLLLAGGCFLLLLWFLASQFPDSTGLGSLTRGARTLAAHGDGLRIDNNDDLVVARVTTIRNDVKQKPQSSVVWSRARPGSALGNRHAVQSGSHSSAVITFDDSDQVRLGENSVIVVRRPLRLRDSQRNLSSLLVMSGLIDATFGEDEGQRGTGLEIVVGKGAVRRSSDESSPSELSLAVRGEASSVIVRRGSAELQWGDSTTKIPAGFMLSYDGETMPGEPVPASSAPRLLAPPDGARFSFRAIPPSIVFRWIDPAVTAAYRIQIAADPSFEELVYETERADSSFGHGNLAAGTYYWRVLTEDDALIPAVSEVFRLVVEQDGVPPPLDVRYPIDPVRTSRATLAGTTDPGCRLLIGKIDVPVDTEGNFRHEIELRHGYNFIVVQSIDDNGNTAFDNGTIVAELEKDL